MLFDHVALKLNIEIHLIRMLPAAGGPIVRVTVRGDLSQLFLQHGERVGRECHVWLLPPFVLLMHVQPGVVRLLIRLDDPDLKSHRASTHLPRDVAAKFLPYLVDRNSRCSCGRHASSPFRGCPITVLSRTHSKSVEILFGRPSTTNYTRLPERRLEAPGPVHPRIAACRFDTACACWHSERSLTVHLRTMRSVSRIGDGSGREARILPRPCDERLLPDDPSSWR
jgi:hypothetical protein